MNVYSLKVLAADCVIRYYRLSKNQQGDSSLSRKPHVGILPDTLHEFLVDRQNLKKITLREALCIYSVEDFMASIDLQYTHWH